MVLFIGRRGKRKSKMALRGNMKRSLLAGLAAAAAWAALMPAAALAQKYPSQDLHVICAFPPGSGADIVVRYFSEKLREKAGGLVLVENKVGAGGNIAAEYTTILTNDQTLVCTDANYGKAHGLCVDWAHTWMMRRALCRLGAPCVLSIDARLVPTTKRAANHVD